MDRVINYFEQKPLISKKRNSFAFWMVVYFEIIKKNHMDIIKREEIKKLCHKINN